MKLPSDEAGGSGPYDRDLHPKEAAASWIEEHADCLYRHVLTRVRNPEFAEASGVMEQGEFWQTMQHCLSKLPAKIANVLCLREMEGVSSKDICALPSIREANLWVMLHRARMALRECLETNWFLPGQSRRS